MEMTKEEEEQVRKIRCDKYWRRLTVDEREDCIRSWEILKEIQYTPTSEAEVVLYQPSPDFHLHRRRVDIA